MGRERLTSDDAPLPAGSPAGRTSPMDTNDRYDVIPGEADPGTFGTADPREKPVQLSLLGPLAVTVAGAPSQMGGHTGRRLITTLAMALAGGSRIEIGALVEAVYGDERPPRPRRSLATLVWRLRQEWGAEAIASDRYHYWLSPDHCAVDVAEFELALAQVRQVPRSGGGLVAGVGSCPADGATDEAGDATGKAGDTADERRIAQLRAAIALWRTDNPATLAVPEPDRSRLDELRLGATEEIATLLAGCGHHREAIELLTPIVAAHPTWERSAALLIETLCGAGDIAAAQHAFDGARRALAAEGVEPGPELQAAARVAFPPAKGAQNRAASGGLRGGVAGRSWNGAGHEPGSSSADPARGAAGLAAIEAGRDVGTGSGAGGGGAAADHTEARSGAAHHTNDPAALIGRGDERDALLRAIHSAIENRRPAAILIRGEAGIGKTTLLRAVLIDAAAALPATVVTVACDHRSTLPLGPLEALADAAPGGALDKLLRAGDGPAHMDDAHEAHTALLQDVRRLADPSGLILAIEDAQFAPRDTVRALVALLQHCGSLPLAVIATTRDPAPTSQQSSSEGNSPDATASFARVADYTVMLTGLDVREVAGMTQDDPTSPWAAHLHRLTGGNPLYVRQLQHIGAAHPPGGDRASPPATSPLTAPLTARPMAPPTARAARNPLMPPPGTAPPAAVDRLASGLPPDLTAAIDAHLAQVPTATLTALETAAAVGDQFGLMTLAALTGPLRRTLTEWQDHVATAIRHGLVRPDGDAGRYRFVHALIAAHLYARLTPGDRARTHAAIVHALQRISLAHPCPADLMAHHVTHGWPEVGTRDVVDAVIAAALAVGAQLDFARSADYYRTALDYLAMDPDAATAEETAGILGAAAGANAAAGDLPGAAELYASQERVAIESGLIRSRIFAALGTLRIAFLRRSHPRAAEPLAAALAESIHDENLRGYLDLAGDALGAVSVYRPQRARELLAAFGPRGPAVTDALRLALWEHETVADQLASVRTLVTDGGSTSRGAIGSETSLGTTNIAAIRASTGSGAGAVIGSALDSGDTNGTADAAGQTGAHQVAAWLRLWVSEVAAGQRRFDEPPARDFGLGDADDQTVFDLAQWRITSEMTAGRFARARTLIKEALAGPKHRDPAERARRAASFYGQALFLALLTGDTGRITDSPIATSPTWMSRHPIMRYIRVYLIAFTGRELQARTMVDELVDEITDGDMPDSDIGPRLILAAETCRRLDHRRGLQACLPGLVAHRAEQGIFRFGQNWGSVRQSLGDVYLALDRPEEAAAAYRGAIADLSAVASVVNVPAAQRGLAAALSALDRPGDRGEIRELHADADAADRAMGLHHRIEAAQVGAEASS